MSPYKNEYELHASNVRSQYAYLFSTVAEIYKFHYLNKKVSSRFEDIKRVSEEMHNDEKLSTYLYESLQEVFKLYPTLLPAEVKRRFKENGTNEWERINKIGELLMIIQADLSLELHDLIINDREEFLRKL